MLIPSPVQKVTYDSLEKNNVSLFVKRDDLIDPEISGNKWRKLKLNLENARSRGNSTLLTFGGAFSNHIAATAKAGKEFGFTTIGIIRGEEHLPLNSTLQKATDYGMRLAYMDRSTYRNKDSYDVIENLRLQYGSFYLIPEGGANYYGFQGCQDIYKELDHAYDAIFLACGTGTTLAGLALASKGQQEIYGIPVLKQGEFIFDNVRNHLNQVFNNQEMVDFFMRKIHTLSGFHFGGYAKVKPELIKFMQDFYAQTQIKLDPIYTAKAAFALVEEAQKSEFAHKSVLLIHTGGLQGIEGFEQQRRTKIY